MAKALIDYDKELPEIEDRRAWEPPSSYLVKDPAAPTGWREEKSGRRPSQLLLVPKIRTAVDRWRAESYPGASAVTRRLFEYWFEDDHEVPGFPSPFRYYFGQREAIETLVWLVEVAGKHDAKELIEAFATTFKSKLFTKNIEFETTTAGKRQVRRYVPESDGVGVQDLPPQGLERYAFRMATGSGKTWVMAMAIVWAHYHRKMVPGSPLSTNFLIVSPNVIVHQRLEKDFAGNAIFHTLPLVPPDWGKFSAKVILRGEASEPDPSGNIFLANIQQLYARDEEYTPLNAVQALLGKAPPKNAATAGQRTMFERLQSLGDLIVLNDEAHHVHEESLAWSQSLLSIHRALPKGLSLWLDFSATPKDQHGMSFPWTVVDYPLAQAVEDRIVKAPLIVTNEADPKQPKHDPDNITAENIGEKYGYWLRAAVERWKVHQKVFKKLGVKPVLFVVAEMNKHADALGACFVKTKEFGFKDSEVLVIHTDKDGDVSTKDLEAAWEAARDIDQPGNRTKVLVSVMMLREGWDVKNVTVVLGLRPFTAKAEILPEQVIGRGLRLMPDIGPDRTQTLEVLGTRNLLSVLRTQLEVEGVGVGTTAGNPVVPVHIEPLQERMQYDIAIPLTRPSLTHEIRKLSDLKVEALEAITTQEELAEPFRIRLQMDFAITGTGVHQADFGAQDLAPAHELITTITNKVLDRAKLPNRFAELYPIVRNYVVTRCFDCAIDPEQENCRSHLARIEIQEGIAKYLARKIGELTLERRMIEFENAEFRLSQTMPFFWRRNLPPLKVKKTVFNYVATYNNFERSFAMFLDKGDDVLRFASLGTTEQGRSGTQFRVDYLKPSGAIGFYHPDWVVVQRTKQGEVNWIIETKGREWEGTEAKDAAMEEWCRRVSAATSMTWRFLRVNQNEFASTFETLQGLVDHIRANRPLWRVIMDLGSELSQEDADRLPADLAANVDRYLYRTSENE